MACDAEAPHAAALETSGAGDMAAKPAKPKLLTYGTTNRKAH